MKEIWKHIRNYEGLYKISNIGRIKSFHCTKKALVERILRPVYCKGHLAIILFKNRSGRRFYVHRLVAEAFILNPLCKKEVNHKNGIKDDNKVGNLEWVTAKENISHAFKTGLISHKGEKNSQSKLRMKDIIKIRKRYVYKSSKNGTIAIAKDFGVNHRTISSIVNRITWKHI